MIEPIYFPHTYVPQWVAEAFVASFKQFCVYQPSGKDVPVEMQPWLEKNAMVVCVPVPAEDRNFTEVVKAFQQFARLHPDVRNLKSAAFWNQQGAIPFFNETSASHIAADLKKGEIPDSGLAEAESLLRARVFLEFAQEFDRQNAELQQELDRADRRSEDLLRNLSGEMDNDPPLARRTADIQYDDPGEYMAQDRLQAWIRLFLEKPVKSGLLITSSSTIFNFLTGERVATEKLFESQKFPVFTVNDDTPISRRDTFDHQMNNLIQSEVPVAKDALAEWTRPADPAARFNLTLYRLPGRTPAQLFAQFLKSPSHERNCNKSNNMAGIRNTLLGLVERNPSDR